MRLNIGAKFKIVEKGINNDNKEEEFSFRYISQTKFEPAQKRPVSIEDIEKQMLKTGSTSFYINNLTINGMPENSFVPIGKLNKIRRTILDQATELLLDYYKPDKKEIRATNKRISQFVKEYKSYTDIPVRNEKLNLSIFADNLELLKMTSKLPIHKYFFDPSFSYYGQEEYFKNIKDLLKEAYSIVYKGKENVDDKLVLVLSSFISDEEIEKISRIIGELEDEGMRIPIMYDTPGIAKSFKNKAYGWLNIFLRHTSTLTLPMI